jgi:hypothetical protein
VTWTDGIFEVKWRVLFVASADGVWVNREPPSVRVGIRREGGRGLEEERVNRMTTRVEQDELEAGGWTRAMHGTSRGRTIGQCQLDKKKRQRSAVQYGWRYVLVFLGCSVCHSYTVVRCVCAVASQH